MKKLKTREWLLIIIILLLAEYVLFSTSYFFKDEQTVLNYISFASTVASLILAVIAIIYGFMQSATSGKANEKIINRIDEFRTIALDLANTSIQSKTNIDKLNNMAQTLDSLQSSMNKSAELISSVDARLDNFDVKQLLDSIKNDAFTDEKSEEENDSPTDYARILLLHSSPLNGVISYALQRYIINGDMLKETDFISKYIKPLCDRDIHASFNKLVLANSAYTIFMFLKQIGLLTKNKETGIITISEELKETINYCADIYRSIESEYIQKAITIIDKI